MAFGDEALNQTAVFEWYLGVKVVRHTFEDDNCSWQPGTSKIDKNVE